MRISRDKNSPDYQAFAKKGCEVWLDNFLQHEWDTADDIEGWMEVGNVKMRGKVEIFRPYGCEPERGVD